jgi:putative peptidoglycan lipid II flippase
VAAATAGLITLTLLSKAFGFARELMIARTFGASADLDAYLLAYAVPELASYLAAYAALNLFLPLYLLERERSPAGAEAFASAFLARSTVILLLGSAALSAAAPAIVSGLAPGLDPDHRGLAVLTLRILSFVLLTRGLEGALRGLANARRRFWVPMFGGVAVSVVVIASLLLWGGIHGITALTLGLLAGTVAPVILLGWTLSRDGAGLGSGTPGGHPLLATCARRLPWFLAIESCGLMLPLVDRAVASRVLEPGNISALAYARTLVEMPFQLLGLAVSTTLFPELAAFFARGDREGFTRILRRGARTVVAAMVPFTVLFVVTRDHVVGAIYERGAFDSTATALTSGALWAYALGLPFVAASSLGMQAAYASARIRLLAGVRALALLVKIGVSLMLVTALGQSALALGSSAFYAVSAVGLLAGLSREVRRLVPSPLLLGGAAAAAGVAAYGVQHVLGGGRSGWEAIGSQAAVWTAGSAVYVLVCRAGRLEELEILERMLLRRPRRGERSG